MSTLQKTPRKKTGGRTASVETLSFESMKAAAVHIGEGCSIDLLRAAKKAGCGAFRNGRIYAKELTEWLKANKPDPSEIQGKESLQIRKLLAQCIAVERENETEAGKLISAEKVREINARVDAAIDKTLENVMVIEMAPKLIGIGTIAEITVKLRAGTDEVRSKLYANASGQ